MEVVSLLFHFFYGNTKRVQFSEQTHVEVRFTSMKVNNRFHGTFLEVKNTFHGISREIFRGSLLQLP